jgi:aminomethyltransferase
MYRAQVALGARFRDDAGWRVAEAYVSAAEEARRARAAVGLVDVGAGGKIGVRGDGVDALLAKLTGAGAPAPGRAARVTLDGAGALACRLAPDELLVVTSAVDATAVGRLLDQASASAGCAHVTDVAASFAALDLLGPAAPRLLARLSPLDLSPAAVEPLGVVLGEVARVRAIVIRLDRPSLPAFRLLIPREYGESVWLTLVDGGRDLGLVPAGAAAHALLMDG